MNIFRHLKLFGMVFVNAARDFVPRWDRRGEPRS
jgi:hypothetical protein